MRLVVLSLLLLLIFASCQTEQEPVKVIGAVPIQSDYTTPVMDKDTNVVSKVVEEVTTSKYTLEELMGKFNPSEHSDFVKMDNKYTDKPDLYLRKAAYADYQKMHAAAKAEGINLIIRSATRNFNYQKGIWERKWTGKTKVRGKDISKTISEPVVRAKEILLYSSMPSTSRHHWGTDIDLNSFDNDYFKTGTGEKVYDWLLQNAPQYGFCQPYTAKGKDRPHGYEEERWHWSYLPIAQPLTDLAEAKLKDSMIEGFKGAETAEEIGVVEKYVLGINSVCRH
ncbi:MAG: M15 family metallopeptidase [Saprospiraceae bacterium]